MGAGYAGRLNKAELRAYRAGRDAFLAMAASTIGGGIAIADGR